MAEKDLDIITTPNFNDEIEDAVAKKHTQGTDQTLDSGGANEVTVADVKDAVTKKHTQNTDTELGALTADINLNAHKILEFATPVTTKTTTDTLTVAEAGLIKVSAASAYTLTLPTAVGHEGLTYHFVKTDTNYNLITLDADGTETFNFPNDDGVPKETYTRLNTYCAEVTVVSDGSNWQCINEKLGQVPECKTGLSIDAENLVDNTPLCIIPFDTADYDIGSNFDFSTWVSGTADGTVANHLQDDGSSQFTSAMVGYRVKNTTDNTYAWITAFNDAGDLTLSSDIFVSGENYTIYHSRFICPVDGTYSIFGLINYKDTTVVADKIYGIYLYKDSDVISTLWYHSSNTYGMYVTTTLNVKANKNQELILKARHKAGVDTVDVYGLSTYFIVRLISKD